ncbi:hypothetical protein D3C80_1266260 [compost metagenome]
MAFLNLGAVVLLTLLDRHDLGRTALAGNPVLRAKRRLARGTAGTMHDLLHAVGDLVPVGFVTQHDIFHRVLVHRWQALDGLGQVRTVPLAVVGNQGRGLGQLQRRGLHVALADPENQGFAREPGLAPGRALPLTGWHEPRRFFEHVQGDLLADAETVHVGGQTVDAQLVGQVVEVGVVGTHDRRIQVHPAVTGAVPVTVFMVVVGQHVVTGVVYPR